MKSDVMEIMESKSIDRNEVLKRLARMKRELARKERKLERSRRAQQAKAHVKQKLREQAFLQDSGQSPSFNPSGDGSIVNTWSSLDTPTATEYSIDSSEQRGITPSLRREQKAKRPFLTRLENTTDDFSSNNRMSKSVDSSRTVCFVSDEMKSGNGKHNDTINGDGKSEKQKEKLSLCMEDSVHKKITISPDLLEVCPVITSSRSKGNNVLENTQDNSLFLTPDPTSSKSSDLNIKKILEESKKDFNDVKMKLDFEADQLLCKTRTIGANVDQRDAYEYSQSFIISKKKRKSTEFCDLDKRKLKRRKSSFSKQPLSTRLATTESGTQNTEQSDQYLSASQTKDKTEMNKKQPFDNCNSKGGNSASQTNTDSVIVVSDSVSESSQSLFQPKCYETSNSKDNSSQNSQSKTKLSLSSDKKFTKSVILQSSEEMKGHPDKRISDSKREVTKPVKTESQNNSDNYLDFTELDVIPFSQFQYSEYLFSSSDILDSVPGKKGRRSHFGMLVQRRSPRLSSGLSNIVGDDIKSEETDSMPSTCRSKSDNSQVLIPVDTTKTDRRPRRKSKKGIIISSVFQFIIDEAKRVKEGREFVLPFHMFNKTLQKRLTSVTLHTTELEVKSENKQIKQEIGSSENECGKSAASTINSILNSGISDVPISDLKSQSSKTSVKEVVPEVDTKDCTDSSLLKEIGYFDTSRKDCESKSVCSTPKLKIESLTTPNRQQYCFTTPKRPPSHMSTPKNNAPFSTPLHSRRSETDLTLSPSLFPSQEPKGESPIPCSPVPTRKEEPASFMSPEANKEDCLIPYCSPLASVKDTTIPFCSPVSATKASPFGPTDLPEDGTCEDETTDTLTKECKDEFAVTQACEENEPENPLSPSMGDGGGTEKRKFCTVGSFHTGRQEAIVSVLCGALHTSGTLVDFVVTLSSSSLGIWSLQDSDWMNELDWILPACSEVNKAWLLPCEDKVVVLVSGSNVKAPVLVTVFVYDWLSGGSNKFNLPLAVSVARPIKFGACCPLTERQIAVFYRQSNKTHGQKMTLSSSFTATVDDIRLESVSEPLCSVSSILDLSQAVVGLATNSTLYVWNHESGLLLQTVDLSLSCPLGDSLISVHSQQGFLLLMVSISGGDNPVCLVAVNPVTAASMNVMSYHKVNSWKGLKASSVYEDFLLVLDKGRSLVVWETNSGQLISRLPNLQATSLDVDPSKEQIISGQADGCVHIYQLF